MNTHGSNSTFVFTNTLGRPVIFRPTGMNRYFTLCSTEYLALGGGNHFALYLDSELLNGSSLASETYGNSCLSHTQEFEVKQVELWGFVYASEYEEAVSMSLKIWFLSVIYFILRVPLGYVGLLNVDGYYNILLALFDNGVKEGFIKLGARKIVLSAPNASELLAKMEEYTPDHDHVAPHESW
ncbi:hypothetical protein LXL04_020705 [Taraxacum kok-saghyz]